MTSASLIRKLLGSEAGRHGASLNRIICVCDCSAGPTHNVMVVVADL